MLLSQYLIQSKYIMDILVSNMNNIYVFYGLERFLIDEEISKIKEAKKIGQVIKHDLYETTISTVVEDVSMISLFDEEKIVIGYNAYFLTSKIIKEEVIHNIDDLSKYIDNPNPNNILILIIDEEKLDKRKNVVKKILSKTIVKEILPLKEYELTKWIKDYLNKKDYQISIKAINLLIQKVGSNLYLLSNECDKLIVYKGNNIINEEDVELLIDKYDYDNIFELTNAVINKDINTSLLYYDELLKRKQEPIMIIVMLANQFRLIYQVKLLLNQNYNEFEISNMLCVHNYRVKIAKEVKLNEKELLKYIYDLAELDENIKTGKVSKDIGLELFLLKI